MRISFSKLKLTLAGALSFCVLALYGNFDKPRTLTVDEVPIAFWAWRTQAPSAVELEKTFTATKARTLFLRSGQFDSTDGDVRRIRPVSGMTPSGVELHLVYNGTRRFLRDLESLPTDSIAEKLANTYQTDISRAHQDGAQIHGIQLDFDVPTRLLPKYAEILKSLRPKLAPETKLSITGLPTWMSSNDIDEVLAAVDFWIPQFYGAEIPTHVTERIPISSASDVGRMVAAARLLGKPFYAGLAAYSYAILYDKDGGLLELRGDIDPATAARTDSLELIRRETFRGDGDDGQTRYEYRAKNDLVLDGLIIEQHQILVFDMPNANSLRASARAVRENAGESLLGICVFRLPTAGDGTALAVNQIVAALQDKKTDVATRITLERPADRQLRLSAENIGTARTVLGQNAVTIDLDIPAGSLNGVVGLSGFSAYETLCRPELKMRPQPCSELRANVVRVRASAWTPGTRASIVFATNTAVPTTVPALVTTRVDDGRIENESFELSTGED